jgi:putative hydrolase of the HAD superfamily
MDVVRKLHKKHKMAILSNNTDEWLEDEEKRFHFSNIFDVIVVSNKEHMAKPDPKFFKIALEKLGNLLPEECLFIDDQDNNINSAKELGFNIIQFEDAEQLIRELKKFGVEV